MLLSKGRNCHEGGKNCRNGAFVPALRGDSAKRDRDRRVTLVVGLGAAPLSGGTTSHGVREPTKVVESPAIRRVLVGPSVHQKEVFSGGGRAPPSIIIAVVAPRQLFRRSLSGRIVAGPTTLPERVVGFDPAVGGEVRPFIRLRVRFRRSSSRGRLYLGTDGKGFVNARRHGLAVKDGSSTAVPESSFSGRGATRRPKEGGAPRRRSSSRWVSLGGRRGEQG